METEPEVAPVFAPRATFTEGSRSSRGWKSDVGGDADEDRSLNQGLLGNGAAYSSLL